jgi:hypothetical protein
MVDVGWELGQAAAEECKERLGGYESGSLV